MSRSATKLRRSVPIRAFIGANGSGKTLLAVGDLVPSLDAGRPVLSAVRLLDGRAAQGDPCVNPRCDTDDHGTDEHWPSHPAWIPLRHLTQLLDLWSADVLLDEVGALVSSRESASMPFQVATLLQQLRKRDLTLTWTAPSWARADKILREVTQLATVCKGYGDRRFDDRLWRGRRLIHAVSYHAADLDDFEVSKVNNPHAAVRPRRQSSEWVRVLKAPGRTFYDTFSEVPSLGFASLSGTCVQCGGKRQAPRCTCADHGMGNLVATPAALSASTRRVAATRQPMAG